MNITFGLTGGIGSGKSHISKIFIDHNIPIVDADIIARLVVKPKTFGLQKIIETYGDHWINSAGYLDRKNFSKMIFSNKENLNKLNSIMFPLIQEEADKQIEEFHSLGHKLVGYDAALIVEMGLYNRFKPLIVVGCPIETQIKRIIKRDDVSYDDAMKIINAQLPLENKKAVADYFIDSSGSKENSIIQTKQIISILRSS